MSFVSALYWSIIICRSSITSFISLSIPDFVLSQSIRIESSLLCRLSIANVFVTFTASLIVSLHQLLVLIIFLMAASFIAEYFTVINDFYLRLDHLMNYQHQQLLVIETSNISGFKIEGHTLESVFPIICMSRARKKC